MTKSELVQVLSDKFPKLEKRDVELAVNCMLGQMTNSLTQANGLRSEGLAALACIIELPVSGGIPRLAKSVEILPVSSEKSVKIFHLLSLSYCLNYIYHSN